MKFIFYRFHFFFVLFLTNGVFGQANDDYTFNITGKIVGRDTGIVVLYYSDPEIETNNISAKLTNGTFHFTGKVNGVSDAHLWTDTSNHNFSDNSVVRFLLEPGNIVFIYDKGKATITGSKSQAEKENFDREKSDLLITKNNYQTEINSLYKINKLNPNPLLVEKMDGLFAKIYSINQLIKPKDFAYIRTHPNSYLSGYLLSTYKRGLSMDTLQKYYSLLGDDIKRSAEGIKVIEYIYPLTNDTTFRNNNPIFGLAYNKKVNEANSIYDFSSMDTSGNLISFKSFKGQYLLLDFWASWCGPCIENIPFLEDLMVEYKSDPIKFVSVSLDTDDADWKAAIKKHDFQGIQLSDLKAFRGMLPVYCKVLTSIPRYVLIDKNGKIINYDSPQPRNPELKILIDNLLKKAD